jgi:RNA polymerase sigma factor (sigma-70 family)
MSATQADIVLRHLRGLAAAGSPGTAPDRQLLEHFAARREGAAFAALVKRHGPMVLGVCRRVLGNAHDAEDVFQATFLTLARKAPGVGRQGSLAGWLYRVAYHAAVRVRARSANRLRHERRAPTPAQADPLAEVTGRELLAVLDEELHRLVERHRLPLVLCYLEDRTCDEAARQLGWSPRTFKRRLDEARTALRRRLERRGLALPAALLATAAVTAAVPAGLAAATAEAARQAAAGGSAAGVLGWKAVSALCLAVGLAAAGFSAFRTPAGGEPPAAAKGAPAPQPPRPAAPEKKTMTVAGRVLDADGKPLAGAAVAVVAHPKVPYKGGELSAGGTRVLGLTKADAEGRFRLDVPRTSSVTFRTVHAVAGGAGYGVGWQELNPDAERPGAEIRLPREQVIRVRFVDVQGQPAAGVRVHLGSIGRHEPGEFEGVHLGDTGKDLPFWPAPAVTDAQGRFEFRGIGQGAAVSLGVSDERFATQSFHLDTDARAGAKEFSRPLEPAHIIEGVVRYADTGQPVPNARLTVYAAKDELGSFFGLDGRADAEGGFRINPSPGNFFHVTAYPPDGEPYLALRRTVHWPKAAVKQHVELKLPRGVLVRGKVTEAGSGKPVAEVSVQYTPRDDNPNQRADILSGWENAAVSGPEGTFSLCVPPGRGHLLVHAPTPHFVLAMKGTRELAIGKPGGARNYAHAFVPLDLPAGGATHEVAVKLRRGVTVKGRLVGPDGKPVAEALMISRLKVLALSTTWRGFADVVRDGRFEVHGLDPAKTYPVHFLDAKNKLGATADLSGKQAGEEVTVRLASCGSAAVRLVDAQGKPVARQYPWLEMVVTPGSDRHDFKAHEAGQLAADADFVANIDRLNHWNRPATDAQGRVNFPALIPGATYRLVEPADMGDSIKKEFTAESGKTVELPDVVRKAK